MPQDEPRSSTQPEYPSAAKRETPWNKTDVAGNSSISMLSEMRRNRGSGSVGLRRCLIIVGLVALVTNGLSLAASQLWVYPDSIDYIVLAGGIADHFDFQNELFLIRTPGYPLFLAAIFKVFGSSSPTAILVIQHLMTIVTTLLATLIAWHVSKKLSITLLAGLFCGVSLQLISYANVVLTETPFTLAVIACVYFLIRYYFEGCTRHLVYSSLCIGVGYLLKPIALFLIGVSAMVVLFRIFRTFKINCYDPWFVRFVKQIITGCAVATIPAILVAAPWMINNSLTHDSLQATRCLDYMYYLRAATFDGLDSTQSPTMIEIHEVMAEAIRRGDLPPDADYRDRQTVIDAYHNVHGITFADSSAILGRAGRDLIVEYPGTIFINTFKYAAWLLLAPDPVYRFWPGAAPGINGQRDKESVLYDASTYALGEGSWEHVLTHYRHYLPLQSEAKTLTPMGTGFSRWFYQRIEHGGKIGFLDSPYEWMIALSLIGCLLSLYAPSRECWFILLVIVSLHVMISSFLSGPQTRYAVVIKPLLLIFLSYTLVWLAGFVQHWLLKFVRLLRDHAPSTAKAMNPRKEPVL